MSDNLPVKAVTDLATMGQQARAVMEYVEAEKEVYRYFLGLAKGLADTQMLAKGQSAQQAANVMLYGHQVHGWKPMKSLRNLTCINNRIGMYSEAMVALVREKGAGTFEYTTCLKPASVTITGKRADTGETFTDTWDVARARDAGLKNPLYATQTLSMLRHRCEAEVCRALFGDIVAGAYTPEELYGLASEPVETESHTDQLLKALGVAGAPEGGLALPEPEGGANNEPQGALHVSTDPEPPPAAPEAAEPPESDEAPPEEAPHATPQKTAQKAPQAPTEDAGDPMAAERSVLLARLTELKAAKPDEYTEALMLAQVTGKQLGRLDPAALAEIIEQIGG